jgi:cardiolipin synthase
MNTKYTLFTEVRPFYRDLIQTLNTAENRISMMYLCFDDGESGRQVAEVLMAKSAEGVRVRLMVDQMGMVLDNPKNAINNRILLNELEKAGVQVDIFEPEGPRLTSTNRLHIKLCAIDQSTVFIGGSNIGDHYLGWQDTNLRLDGELGSSAHMIYDYISQFSAGTPEPDEEIKNLDITRHKIGDAEVLMTIPGSRRDVQRSILDMILDSEKTIYMRTWYFLPNSELLNAMLFQAERGKQIKVLLSHRTRVPLIDVANHISCHKLAKVGGLIFRYKSRYMHSKATWNSAGEVIFGSANMDEQALKDNFEFCLRIKNVELARQLTLSFEKDGYESSQQQTSQTFRKKPFPMKVLSHLCALATPWL